MKLQRVAALINKELKKTFRESAVLFMIFLFPAVFVLTFGVAFGGLGGTQPAYSIGVVNLDRANMANFTQSFLEVLSATKILSIQVYVDNQTAQIDLSQGKLQAVMVIPPEFSQSLVSYHTAPDGPSKWVNTTISLHLDKGSIVATQAIPPIIQQVLTAFTGRNQQATSMPIILQVASLVETKRTTAFEFMAPGMFTFASIFILMMVAQSFTQDRENGMLRRMRLTPTTSTEFMISQVLSYMLIALIQAVIVFIAAYLMGFRPNVGFPAYIMASILVLTFSLSNVGFGLITATVAKTSDAATGMAFLFVLPQLFLGTFVGASLSSYAQVASKFVPSYYVTDALTSLFLRGASLTSPTILFDAMVVAVSCIIILAVGIILYAKYCKI
ncbi:ABC transporter permease [Candidatus Bathyarchaeota archaeon]|nr:ABC transporter permease [Candidatus Bathyarchaeota archaeon]